MELGQNAPDNERIVNIVPPMNRMAPAMIVRMSSGRAAP